MTVQTLVDVICATHLARYVESPFKSCGGLMLVGPPEALKTSMLGVLEDYPDAIIQSDLNSQQLTQMRDEIAGGAINTLALLDIQKIYERHSNVASNLEGNLRALADEGFVSAAFQDARMNRIKARCTVMGACTPAFLEEHFQHWHRTGFLRRFLFCMFKLDRPDLLQDAVEKWRLLDLGIRSISPPVSRVIPNMLSAKERAVLRRHVKHQYGGAIPYQLLCKIAAVLKWHYSRVKRLKQYHRAMAEFCPSLGKSGAVLIVPTNGGKHK